MILHWGLTPVEMTETDGVWQGSLAEGLSLKAWEQAGWWNVSLHVQGRASHVLSGPHPAQHLAENLLAAVRAVEARDKSRQERLGILDGIFGRFSAEMKAQRGRRGQGGKP